MNGGEREEQKNGRVGGENSPKPERPLFYLEL